MMNTMKLGKTDLKVSRTGFGALPIQRCSGGEATEILRRAYAEGINFFDTARVYTDSEEKIGNALHDVRHEIFIASKTMSTDPDFVRKDLELSLRLLRTDYLDLYQFHNHFPEPEIIDLVQGLIREGKIRHMGITLHKRDIAFDAVKSGLFETLQFPFSGLSDDEDIRLVRACEAAEMGFIAMKGLSGGLIRDIEANFAFIRQMGSVLPIWGIQRMEELEQFIELENSDIAYTEVHQQALSQERAELGDHFCRGCGYCLPCPAKIDLAIATRINLFIQRSPYRPLISRQWQEKMACVEQCTDCRACAERCPYGLKPYELVREQFTVYREFVEAHAGEVPDA
jgi:aryl-alcohol dehydrogenase-like predicted oxidoreductase